VEVKRLKLGVYHPVPSRLKKEERDIYLLSLRAFMACFTMKFTFYFFQATNCGKKDEFMIE